MWDAVLEQGGEEAGAEGQTRGALTGCVMPAQRPGSWDEEWIKERCLPNGLVIGTVGFVGRTQCLLSGVVAGTTIGKDAPAWRLGIRDGRREK